MNPLSERLVFINNQDQAQVIYQSDKENFDRRSLVKNKVTLTDSDGEPLTGNFSVSVTSDREVMTDTTTSILTQLLLASDLRGHIENPAYYFQNSRSSVYALDLLMLTQGWRRYNIAELAQGRFSRPTFPVEIGTEISGTVKSVMLGRPVEDIEVIVASFKDGFFNNTKTDKDGRFYLKGGELPDSTRFLVHAVQKRGMTRSDLIIDKESFPKRTLSVVPPAEIDRFQFARYANKAELQYTYEGGFRVYSLSEVTISADRKSLIKSDFYDISFVTSITEKDIEKMPGTDIYNLLMRVPGVQVSGKNITIRGVSTLTGNTSPLLLVDNTPMNIENLDYISVHDIAQIDVLKGPEAAIFGSRGSNGVIAVHTKRGEIDNTITPIFHIKTITPLGYQQPVEFYAPKYDTPIKRNAQTPDLRTTIHWQPVVQTDSAGVASFEFYTADELTSYTVIIEGLANDGKIIRQEGMLWRKDE
jgi:TonB-dependent SusC/RagA subfamily outer membrane receptor